MRTTTTEFIKCNIIIPGPIHGQFGDVMNRNGGLLYLKHLNSPATAILRRSVGPDLAPLAAARDEKCMAKYIPKFPEGDGNIHQATNS